MIIVIGPDRWPDDRRASLPDMTGNYRAGSHTLAFLAGLGRVLSLLAKAASPADARGSVGVATEIQLRAGP